MGNFEYKRSEKDSEDVDYKRYFSDIHFENDSDDENLFEPWDKKISLDENDRRKVDETKERLRKVLFRSHLGHPRRPLEETKDLLWWSCIIAVAFPFMAKAAGTNTYTTLIFIASGAFLGLVYVISQKLNDYYLRDAMFNYDFHLIELHKALHELKKLEHGNDEDALIDLSYQIDESLLSGQLKPRCIMARSYIGQVND